MHGVFRRDGPPSAATHASAKSLPAAASSIEFAPQLAMMDPGDRARYGEPRDSRESSQPSWYAHIRERNIRCGTAFQAQAYARTVFETEHPVVRVIPETGERSPVLGTFVRQFIELQHTESQQLLAVLQSYITKPENTVRWRWCEGDSRHL